MTYRLSAGPLSALLNNMSMSSFLKSLGFEFRTGRCQILYTLLILLGLPAQADPGVRPTFVPTTCATALVQEVPASARYFVMAPRLRGEIVRLHKVFSSGEVLEFRIFTGLTGEEPVPGYLQDLAVLIQAEYPGAAEAIRTHGVRASIEFVQN